MRIEREYIKGMETIEELTEQGEKLQQEIRDQQLRMMQERRIHAQVFENFVEKGVVCFIAIFSSNSAHDILVTVSFKSLKG